MLDSSRTKLLMVSDCYNSLKYERIPIYNGSTVLEGIVVGFDADRSIYKVPSTKCLNVVNHFLEAVERSRFGRFGSSVF